MVLLHNGEPVEVWTGSTNFTDGGIFGHSNCGHIVRKKDVAATYFKYWEELQKDPEMRDIRPGTMRFSRSPMDFLRSAQEQRLVRGLIWIC